MTQLPDINFWKEEQKGLGESLRKLKDEIDMLKKPCFFWDALEEECNTLQKFFSTKIVPTGCYSSEQSKQLESEARALGYDHTKGVKAWLDKRIQEEKGKLFKKQKEYPPTKVEGERATVKRFYKNNGRSLKDEQIIVPQKKNFPVDVDITVVEEGKEVHYQVTLFRRKTEGALLEFRMVSYEVKLEDFQKDIIETIKDKELRIKDREELKSRSDIILLLYSLFPEEKYVEKAVTGLSIDSSFREIYVVMPNRNISVKRSI